MMKYILNALLLSVIGFGTCNAFAESLLAPDIPWTKFSRRLDV